MREKGLTRRQLLKWMGVGLGALYGGRCAINLLTPQLPETLVEIPDEPEGRDTMFYRKVGKEQVVCEVCFRRCRLSDGQTGFCRNRVNRSGKLVSIVYGLPAAVHVDPIEKEPQYHFLPGTQILCMGTAGCNFRCQFCQNWRLSQRSLEEMAMVYDWPPETVLQEAQSRSVPSISFTYNEPTTFYEYMYDCAELMHQAGINTIFHTNGSMNREALETLLPYVSSVTVDLKGFTESFYDKLCHAELEPVLKSLQVIKRAGVWLEIVNLVIPDRNDDPNTVRDMSEWLVANLGADTPLHFSRFFPQYRLTELPPTPVTTLERCRDMAMQAGLHYVSIGNVPGHEYNSTFCPRCEERLVERYHFNVHRVWVEEGRCPFCGREIAGVWTM